MTRLSKIGVAVVAALVALDVVLVTLALRHVSGNPAGLTDVVSTPRPTRTASPAPSPSRTVSPEVRHRTARPNPAAVADAQRTLVDIGSDRAVARATSGRCGKGGAKVELSLDGGRTFEPAKIPAAAVVLRVASTDADKAYVVATDPDCRVVTTFTTTNGGGAWERTDGSEGSWHRLARAAARIHAPTGAADVPCERDQVVTGFSTLSTEQAYALCSDGAVLRTVDGAKSWSPQGTVPGATDLDFVDPSNGLAVTTSQPSCAGVAVLATTDGAKTWKARTCVKTSAGGVPDVSADGKRAYLAVGESVWFSDDGGSSWERRSS